MLLRTIFGVGRQLRASRLVSAPYKRDLRFFRTIKREESKFKRFLSTSTSNAPQPKPEGAPPPTTITFVEGAQTASRLGLYLGIAGFVTFCAYLIGRELMPTRMSPNSVFNRTFEKIREHPEVVQRVGTNPKAYGRDFHQSKEGRRNFIDHDRYTDLDGVKFIRITFTIEGESNKIKIYAEVSDQMSDDEFSYIILEERVRGMKNAIALLDNRKELTREELQEKVSKKLTKLGATLYGRTDCQWTQRQLVEFGDFAKELKSVMCDKPENEEQCTKAKLKGFPVWVLGVEQLPGFQPLSQLRDIVQRM